MRSSGIVVGALMLLGASSCSMRETTTDCSDYGNSPSAYMLELTGQAGSVTRQDRIFVCQAAIDGLAQASLGQLAEQKAQDPAVREFAHSIVADHSATSALLERLATQQVGTTLPTRLDAKHLEMLNRLASLSGSDFDRAYMQSVVEDYQSAIEHFGQQASLGSEPALQRFAAGNLPVLEADLLIVQRIEAQLGASPAKPS
jgi:putative membrane protein